VPAFPRTSAHARSIRASTFEAFAAKLRAKAQEPGFAPLHLGDVHLLPPPSARALNLDDPSLHRYGPVTGEPALREAGAADLSRFGLSGVDPADVFVCAGATGGLDLALNATCEPGDEVLVLTPTWPLILGLLQRRGCTPVQVDVDPSGWLTDDPAPLREALVAALSERTVGISLCNPNNPGGFIYGREHLAVVAELARAHDLWIYYDAVYVDLTFGEERVLGFVQGPVAERTFVVTSFSKSFGLAGHRVGLLTSPPAARDLIPRLQTHSTYHAASIGQRMALAALGGNHAKERERRLRVARMGARLASEFLRGAVDFHAPAGGAFLLLDLRERAADEAELLALLDRCLDAGVSLAPGSAFGDRFGRFARLCFTATPPDLLIEGVKRVRAVLR